MKSIFKYVGIIGSILLSIILLIIITSYINHKIHLSKEDKLFVPNGKMVQVNNHNMHVYTEGQGDTTLVFLSGAGTSSPLLDFKSLYSLLSEDYKIVVLEKAGYGFSDDADVDRDIDTILAETREALSKAQIKGPYVLVPHSMSGIEALYWAQKYPDEVTSIIGLDMAVPMSYKGYNINKIALKLADFSARVGMTRWIPGASESDAIKYGTLTENEKELYRTVFYRRTLTKAMVNEIKQIKSNAKVVDDNPLPKIPILIFSSNGEKTGMNKYEWKLSQNKFISNIENGKIIHLDSSHYVHDIDYKKISETIKKTIETQKTN